ncbi:ferritin [Persicimonas caeni]|uniref:Ferritin n=1 Tax=Persicimonas caeni TaxID=2292766 RepID=A0A4Y6PPS3_PERCE|nr:ferritin-like domain-containing protein [Persicimonas caeni]QDG50336.1 ferritin [Persicimonas caeni]QED31557.1 ferritin [Persicimonas caeni]
MATKEEFIDRLNDALSWELAGIIQYMQHSVMVTGPLRESLADFFSDGSEEARDHAEDAGKRIAALGAVPTVEPAKIRQATDVEGMLEAALALEEDALAAWEDALEASDAVAPGYGFWIEEQIAEEQEHVDELRKMTNKVSFSDADVSGGAENAG